MLLNLGITFDGLQEMVEDLIAEGFHPRVILLHPIDAQELKEDVILNCPDRSPDAENTAAGAIAIIKGCVVGGDPQVPRGQAHVVGPDIRERIN
jgi:hypothetical protein